MKKITSVLIFTVVLAQISIGDDLLDNCGCGLGSTIFEGKDTFVIQIFAATSNAPTQVFGISSGTLGCEQPIEIVQHAPLKRFVSKNMDNLAKDVAKGHGEYLEALADTLGVATTNKTRFYSKLKKEFKAIFNMETVTHHHVVDKINNIFLQI